ncbi:uncharacterized protein J3D65DRAFT_618039 [Phyllosticta citribraziliensis]|uniref:DUF7708 domain-containing protein n=1 Tax=Phyllosticta citribraziliensis TaxID=989973 RepID=A0ABR1LVN3_9PEZI
MLRRRATMPDEQVVNFMKEHLDGSIHGALDTRPQAGVKFEGREWKPTFEAVSMLEPREDGLVKVEASTTQDMKCFYMDCIKAQDKLRNTMEKYQTVSRDRCIELKRQQTWKDVEEGLDEFSKEVVKAEHEYREKLGSVRSGFRRFSNNSNSVKVFADLIPSSDSYLSVLCGGIKLVCVAASRIGQIRKIVTEFLLQIHSLLDDKGKLLDLYSRDIELHRRNAELSTCILVVLAEIVRWLYEKPWKKTMKGMLRPESYEHPLIEKIDEIKIKATAFKDQANFCEQKNVVDIASDTSLLRRDAEHNQIRQGIIYETMKSGHEAIRGELEILKERTKSLNYVLECLQSDPKRIQEAHPYLSKSKLLKSAKPRELKYKIEDLEEIIAYDPAVVEEDCTSMRKLQFTMKPPDQDKAVSLLRNERLQGFVTAQRSGMLLIHGHGNTTPLSPVSFVCAKLVESLVVSSEETPSRILSVAFFCGRHRDETRDVDAHPPGMLLSMLFQLLEALRHESREINSRPLQRALKHFEPDNVDSILEVFAGVVKQLPPEVMLFVVADAVVFYEDRHRREEMKRAVEGLLELAFIEDGPAVKVLMSSPSKTHTVLETFKVLEEDMEESLILDMHKSYPTKGGFRSLNWTLPSPEISNSSDEEEDE